MLFNPLKPELNPIWYLLALLGGATIVVVSRLRVKFVFSFFQCKILLYFGICNFKATSTKVYHSFLSNPTILKKWTCNIGCPKILLKFSDDCNITKHNTITKYTYLILRCLKDQIDLSKTLWCSGGMCECVMSAWKWVVRAGKKT